MSEPITISPEQLERFARELGLTQGLHAQLRALRDQLGPVVLACDAIPDITISKWACDPGGPWNRVREALRARRAAQGFDVDVTDPETAFDEHGWLKQRKVSP